MQYQRYILVTLAKRNKQIVNRRSCLKLGMHVTGGIPFQQDCHSACPN